jgi:GH24 family phage-related lysozyme (muramidase)
MAAGERNPYGNAATGLTGGTGTEKAKALLREFEGFRERPYWDVNAYRAGYGSDTLTSASGGISRVQPGSRVNKEGAERDLTRRVDDLFSQLGVSFGEAFKGLPAAAQAAIASVYYNYGKIPSGVASAIRKGDLQQIGTAVGALGGDDGGVNRARRTREADIIRSSGGSNASIQSGLMDRFGVAWQSQLDNASGQGWRECFTTVSAMIASGAKGRNISDDEFAKVRQRFGDTTSMPAQVQALRSMGVDAKGTTTASKQDLIDAVSRGMTVGIGVTSSLNGHWLYVTGASSRSITAFDPNSLTPKQIEVPWEKFLPNGPNGGYMVTAPRAPGSIPTGGMATMPDLGPLPVKPVIAPIGVAPRLGAVPNFNAQTEKFNELQQRSADLAERSLDIERGLAKARMDAAEAGLEENNAAVFQQFKQPLLDANRQLKDRAAYEREYGELLANGTLPALAEQLASATALERTQLRLLEIEEAANAAAIATAIARIESNELKGQELELEKEKLKILEAQRAAIPGTRSEISALGTQNRELATEAESPEARRQRTLDEYNTRKNEREDPNRRFDTYMKAKSDLEDLLDPTNQIISAANGVSDAFGQAFKDIASGSKTAQEALSDMFTNIGASFLDMAAKILAQQVLLSILSAFGFGGGGGAGNLFGNNNILNSGIGAGFGGARAGGGPVSGGSSYLVGEQGPELFVPGVSGSIMPASDTKEALKPSGQMMSSEDGNAEITYSGPVLRFNEQDYVSKGDIPKIIRSSVVATSREMRSSVPFRRRAGM